MQRSSCSVFLPLLARSVRSLMGRVSEGSRHDLRPPWSVVCLAGARFAGAVSLSPLYFLLVRLVVRCLLIRQIRP